MSSAFRVGSQVEVEFKRCRMKISSIRSNFEGFRGFFFTKLQRDVNHRQRGHRRQLVKLHQRVQRVRVQRRDVTPISPTDGEIGT